LRETMTTTSLFNVQILQQMWRTRTGDWFVHPVSRTWLALLAGKQKQCLHKIYEKGIASRSIQPLLSQEQIDKHPISQPIHNLIMYRVTVKTHMITSSGALIAGASESDLQNHQKAWTVCMCVCVCFCGTTFAQYNTKLK
jgi:hypothetical protein